jgi:hypothetical protein
MNTENNIKEFGFCHISINTVYNGSAGNGLPLSCVVNGIFIFSLYYKKPLKQRETTKGKCII